MTTPNEPSMLSNRRITAPSSVSDFDIPIIDAPSMISYTRVTPSLLPENLKWYAHAVAGKLVTSPRVHDELHDQLYNEFHNEFDMCKAPTPQTLQVHLF